MTINIRRSSTVTVIVTYPALKTWSRATSIPSTMFVSSASWGTVAGLMLTILLSVNGICTVALLLKVTTAICRIYLICHFMIFRAWVCTYTSSSVILPSICVYCVSVLIQILNINNNGVKANIIICAVTY